MLLALFVSSVLLGLAAYFSRVRAIRRLASAMSWCLPGILVGLRVFGYGAQLQGLANAVFGAVVGGAFGFAAGFAISLFPGRVGYYLGLLGAIVTAEAILLCWIALALDL